MALLGVAPLLAFLCLAATVTATVVDRDEMVALALEADIDDVDSPGYHPSFSRLRRRSVRVRRDTADRPGEPTLTHSCSQVRAVPGELRNKSVLAPSGASSFYQKYTEAYGIPVLSSGKVSDEALRRACYVLRFALADVASVRRSFYKRSGRVGVMADTEVTTDIPEHKSLGEFWNSRARGMGGTPAAPISTAAMENLLCWNSSKDRYSSEDIMLHELIHGVHLLGANFAFPDFNDRLKELYNRSKQAGRWIQTYAMTNHLEYFAEGVQSYFHVNTYSNIPNGVHNSISTREKLRLYDPGLYQIIAELFPCNNNYLDRCNSTRDAEEAQVLQMDCQPPTQAEATATTPLPADCRDLDIHCVQMAADGLCEKSPAYMLENCRRSCSFCNPIVACEDTDETCPRKATIGACGLVSDKCPKSCGACPSQDDPYPCQDLNSYCTTWAASGECGGEYMSRYCRRACGLCWQRPFYSLLQSMMAALQIASSSVQGQSLGQGRG